MRRPPDLQRLGRQLARRLGPPLRRHLRRHLRRLRPVLLPALLVVALALIAGDGGWWYRDWWGDRWPGAVRGWIDRLSPPSPLETISAPACLQALAASGAGFVRIADFATSAGCRVDAAVRVTALAGAVPATPFVAGCPLALALQRHMAETVQPAATALLGSPVARIAHVGSFACRRIRGRPNGPLSEHAFARALDVTGYVLADGRTVMVAADWRGTADPQRRFLHRIVARHGPFSTVITPDDDRLHHDHFHLGIRPPR